MQEEIAAGEVKTLATDLAKRQVDGCYLTALSLWEDSNDLHLWTDRTDDRCYNTDLSTIIMWITDRNTGETVSTLTGIQIPHRWSYLPTITGMFLMAGRTTGGVQIPPEWGEKIMSKTFFTHRLPQNGTLPFLMYHFKQHGYSLKIY